jgi:hypothetical protein
MRKWTALFFFFILAKAGHSQSYSSADTVVISSDTLPASLHLVDAEAGDTLYFGIEGQHPGELLQFFKKNAQAPRSGDSVIKGIARVYFIIDKTGRVTQAWYDKESNSDIGLAMVGIVNNLPVIRPSRINGEAVITKVLLKVLVEENERPYGGKFEPDITISVPPASSLPQ